MHKHFKSLALALLLASASATADEVWNSTIGPITYARDVGPTAVWSYSHAGYKGNIYILGLAGNYKQRGKYEGYWAQPLSRQKCNTPRPGPGNRPTYYWGKVRVRFLDPSYPSRWVIKRGFCNGKPNQQWEGTPR